MMFRTRILLLVSVACAVFFAGQVASEAASIAVSNASFEEPVRGPGVWADLDTTGTNVPGWQKVSNVTDIGTFGAFNMGGGVTGTFELNVGFDNVGGHVWQDLSAVTVGNNLGVNLAANTTYTLNVDLLRRKFNDSVWQTTIPLYVALHAGGNLLGYLDTPYTFAEPYAAEVKKDLELVVVTGGAPVGLGDPLWIELGRTETSGAGFGGTLNEIHYDNVRLDATTVPEPSGLILLALGLFGLPAYAWRKQR